MFHAWSGGPNPFRAEAMSGLTFAAMNASTDPRIQARVEQLVTGEPIMFFDTERDPTERVNVAKAPSYSDEFRVLSRKLLEEMRRTDDPLVEAFTKALER